MCAISTGNSEDLMATCIMRNERTFNLTSCIMINEHELCIKVKLVDNFSVFARIWMKNDEKF